jgi:hypothetical protein
VVASTGVTPFRVFSELGHYSTGRSPVGFEPTFSSLREITDDDFRLASFNTM